MNEVLQVIRQRRAVRSHKEDMIPDKDLEQILEAGRYAASAHNGQPCIALVIRDRQVISRLNEINAAVKGVPGTDQFYGAPVVIAVLADKREPTYIKDGSLVIGNMMLAAKSLGIASCWINRADKEFESDYGKKLLSSLGISDDYAGVGHCILGYAKGDEPAAKPRKEKFSYYI